MGRQKVVRKKADPKPLKPWGAVFEHLRGLEKQEVAKLAAMEMSEYRRICVKSKGGPTHNKIGRILFAVKTSWEEYGHLFDALNPISAQDLESLHDSINSSLIAQRKAIDALAQGDQSPPIVKRDKAHPR